MSKFPLKFTKDLFKFHFKHHNHHHQSRLSPNSTLFFSSSSLTNEFSQHAAAPGYNTLNKLWVQELIRRPVLGNGFKFNYPSSFVGSSCRKYSSAGYKSGSVGSGSSDIRKKIFNPLGIWRFSVKNLGLGGKIDGGFEKKVVQKPMAVFSWYTEARNAAGCAIVCIVLWRIMFGIANTFVGLSEGMAKDGFLALSYAIVAFGGMYLRARYTINPGIVYRIAMRRLNTSAGILEVMGAPLTGIDLKTYWMSGGVSMSKFRPKLRSKRCFLMCPIQGSEKDGLLTVEVEKKKGQYDMKVLAVDFLNAAGQNQRLFLIGNEEEYRVGGELMSLLRDRPIAMLSVRRLGRSQKYKLRGSKTEL